MSLVHPLNMSTHVVGTYCSLDHIFELQMLHNLHTPLKLIEMSLLVHWHVLTKVTLYRPLNLSSIGVCTEQNL